MRMTPVRIMATSIAAGALVFTAGFGVGRATEGLRWHSLPPCDWSKVNQDMPSDYVCDGPAVPERLTPYACLISADRDRCDTIYARSPESGICQVYYHVKDGWRPSTSADAADYDCPIGDD